MSAHQLRLLLASGDMVADTLRDAVALCDAWYAAEPSLSTFTLRSLFQDLAQRGWTDQQGAPQDQYAPFQSAVVPHLVQIADTLSATPAAEPIDVLDALVVAYRESTRATP